MAWRTSGCLQSCCCQRELKHGRTFQNNHWDNRSFRPCKKSPEVYANSSLQSTSQWLLCKCLVLVAAIIMSKGGSLSFLVFTRALLLNYQDPVNRKSRPSYFNNEKINIAMGRPLVVDLNQGETQKHNKRSLKVSINYLCSTLSSWNASPHSSDLRL